jgi:hypothetical protein
VVFYATVRIDVGKSGSHIVTLALSCEIGRLARYGHVWIRVPAGKGLTVLAVKGGGRGRLASSERGAMDGCVEGVDWWGREEEDSAGGKGRRKRAI